MRPTTATTSSATLLIWRGCWCDSARHLDIAELLVDDAQKHDSMNRDLTRLKDTIQQEKLKATANGVQQLTVNGTAQDYAANAYKLLEG